MSYAVFCLKNTVFCFFLMIRRPPSSTLFPLHDALPILGVSDSPVSYRIRQLERKPAGRANRSEEHTSELQSLRHVVCRLLLEKHSFLFFFNDPPTPELYTLSPTRRSSDLRRKRFACFVPDPPARTKTGWTGE